MEPKKAAEWAVLIIEHDGRADFLGESGGGEVAVYPSKMRAEQVAALIRETLGDEVQNVRVARYYGEKCTGRIRLRA